MFDDRDEETEFWSNVPDSRLDRFRTAHRRPARQPAAPRPPARPAGSRSHGDPTGSIPVVTAVDDAPRSAATIDPLVKRMGGLAVVVALLVPVAMALRADDRNSGAALQPEGTSVSAPGGDAVAVPAETASADPWAAIDIDALPEAVPANPDPASSAVPSTGARTTAAAATTAPAQPAKPSTSTATTAVEVVSRPQAKTTASTCAKKYTVRAGDAWLLIADRADVSLSALLAANNATAATAIYPGRTICLPANATTPKPPTVTTSKPRAPSTTAPKPTTTTAAPAPVQNYSRAQVERIIRQVWPDNLEDEAVRIAIRESNLTPTARNYCCYGLFQIYWNVHKSWLAHMGITSSSQLFDPKLNAQAALALWFRSGSWAPWR